MNAKADGLPHASPLTRAERLLKNSVGGFDTFAASLRPLYQALQVVEQLGTKQAGKSARKHMRQLDQFEPSITMIGQIKSGKTTLVNSMVGWAGLLPADVNPWTSVVTSLHLSPKELSPDTSATFRFFDNDEWARLVTGGGRIGELAGRAGAEDELSMIKAQVEQMREKSKARLGRKFEMLLGKEHTYGYFDRELVERYVCLGDDFDDGDPTNDNQGRFADITKSADLSMQQRALPINLCVRDTPGVNDTFMMREQITIKSIRDSRICVVVLSAHQALSSTDFALVRLIANVKSRDVIIFVNRIDELSDPKTQVPQIKASILETLEKRKAPTDAEVIFGSALWAQSASLGKITSLPNASQNALLNWAQATKVQDKHDGDPHGYVWELSGLPALFGAIASRIASGEGEELRAEVSVAARNLVNDIRVSDNLAAKARVGSATVKTPHSDVMNMMQKAAQLCAKQLEDDLDTLCTAFQDRADRAHASFLSRATDELAKHLEAYGESSVWSYDPAGLRMLLNSAYKTFGAKCQSAYQSAADQALQNIRAIYKQALDVPLELLDLQAPPPPRIPPPVSLGQTIALDLQGSWWKGWWMRRRSYRAHAESFHTLIKAETENLVSDLTGEQAAIIRQDMASQLHSFLEAQVAGLSGLTQSNSVSEEEINALFGVQELEEREAALQDALHNLEKV